MKNQLFVKTTFLLLCALTTFPQLGNTQSVMDEIKQGAAKAKDKMSDVIDSTKESLDDEETPEATRKKLNAMAENTLAKLFADKPSAADLFKQSYGYAVFDTRKISLSVKAGYGRGVAVVKATDARTYMEMALVGVDVDIGFGGHASRLVILFENAQHFQKLIDEGIDAKAEASAQAGNEKKDLSADFADGEAIFLLTNEGWKIKVQITGAKYWKDDDLNAR